MGNPEEEAATQQNAAHEPKRPPTQHVSQEAGDSVWDRIKRHKVVEWSLAYIAFGYAALHGSQMLRETFEWPLVVPRFTFFALLLGLPFAVTLAWYHGHRAQHRVSRTEISILAALLVIAGSMLWVVSRSSHERDAASIEPARTSAAHTLEPQATVGKSIAVLPFVDMSEKHDLAYFGDGLADQILNELARIPALKVIGRTSSFRFRDKADDLREVGRMLGVNFVLEGSVRGTGEELRVTAQLVDARDGSHRWSQTYDRTSGNVLQLQEEIATAIARVLQMSMAANFTGYVAKSPEAFDLYLRGVRDLDLATPVSTRRALTEFEHAEQLDPKFVPAVISQAMTYNVLAGNAYMTANEAFPRAQQTIERALTIDPRNADAYATRALIRVNYDRNWEGAAADITRAKELGGSRIAYLPAAKLAGATGDMARAAEIFEAQLATDPLDGDCLLDLGWVVYPTLQRYEEADVVLRRAREADPEYTNSVAYFSGISLLLRGRPDEAATLINSEKDEASRQALRAAVDYAKGRLGDSDAAMRRAIAAPNPWPFAVARSYAYRGDKQEALAWLNKAADDHESLLWIVKTDPMLRNLAGDAGFRTFLRRMNLTE